MGFLDTLAERARARARRIVFPEWDDPRVLTAVTRLHELGTVIPVVLAPSGERAALRDRLPGIELMHADDPAVLAQVAAVLQARSRTRPLDDAAARRLADDPLMVAAWCVATGAVHGCVAGAVRTTADVLRAAIRVVGTADDVQVVSSAFYMVVPPFREAGEEVLTFTDCAVVPDPDADRLADIAIAAADARRRIVGDEPVVALLSFATHGSAAGPAVARVEAADAAVRARRPDLVVDGPLQVDAALLKAVGRRKAPDSAVAGRANVLVFPSLDAGNIGYKLVERLAGAAAIGPILQGLRSPCNDLSRGASPDDIMSVAAITALAS